MFSVPNFADALDQNQADPDAVDYTLLSLRDTGVGSGCVVSPSVTPDLQVAVSGGVVKAFGKGVFKMTAQSVACPQNTTTGMNRFVIIYAKTDGTFAAFVDAARDGAQPTFPSYTSVAASTNFACVLAAVWRPGGVSPPSITAPYIVPKTIMLQVAAYEPLSPRMFGAAGDDATADGTAVQNCEAACRVLGRALDLGSSIYRMRNPARNGTDGSVTSVGSSTDPTTWLYNSATLNATIYDVGKGLTCTGVLDPATTIVAINSATQVRLSLQPIGTGSAKTWQVAFGAALLISDMAAASGGVGDLKVKADGRGRTQLHWIDDPGCDIYGMPRYYWNWLNTNTDNSGDIQQFTINGAAGGGSIYNPNLTPIPFTKGYGLRLPNRMSINKVSINHCHTGLVADGANNAGFYVTLPKTNGVNYVDIDLTLSPVPPLTVIGMFASGEGIPKGSLVSITGVQHIGSVWRLTLSANLTNVGSGTSTDLQIDTGQAVVQHTDHFTTHELTIGNCRDGYLTKSNSGLTGGGGTGTADQRHHELSIGQMQRAAVVCAENGYLRDITFDSLHMANSAIGFLKEGTLGIVPSQNTFVSETKFLRAKSEGTATKVFYDISRRAVCDHWWGTFQFKRGCAINGTKTHRVIGLANQHAILPHGAATSTGLPDGSVTATRVTTTGVTSIAITGTLPTNPAVNVGDHVGVYSTLDPTFVDCGVISAIGSGVMTVLVGAQTKQLTALPFVSGGATTISIDVNAGGLNIKNPDVGATVSLLDGTFVGIVDTVSFFDQTFTMTSCAVNSPAGPNAGIKLTMTNQPTGQAVQWGPIAAIDIGELLDCDVIWQCDDDDSTQNIHSVLFWQFYNFQRNNITLESNDFPSINITHVPFTNPLGFSVASTIKRFNGTAAVVPLPSGGIACSIGDTLEYTLHGGRQQRQAATSTVTPYGGIARTPGTSTIPTNSALPAAVFTQGFEPYVYVAREYICAQTRGVTYLGALNEGGGANTSLPNNNGANQLLVIDRVSGHNGQVTNWDGVTRGLIAVGIGMNSAQSGRIDMELIEPYLTYA